MPTYDDDHAKSAVAKLIEVGAGSVTDGRYEIQDNGEFLLLTAELTSDMSKPDLAGLGDRIKRLLSRELPTRRGNYPWMVVLNR